MTGIVVAGAVLVGAPLLLLGRAARKMLRPPRRPFVRTADDVPHPYEDVTFRSGNLDLRGWLFLPRTLGDRKPVVVVSHGWGSNSGDLLTLAEPAVEAGFPVLVYDFRLHGRSDDAPYVTVRHYRDDVMAAAAFVSQRLPGRPVVLAGHSMGGAASVLAAAEGAEAAGVFLVATPADIIEVSARYFNGRLIPGVVWAWALMPFWLIRARARLGTLRPDLRIGDLRVPVGIVHPDVDRQVPADHPHRLAEAAGTSFVVIKGSGHTAVLRDSRTSDELVDFLRRIEAA